MSLLVDVFDVILKDNQNGNVIATTTLQDANLEVSVDENEVRGGRSNALLAVLRSNKDVAISLSDVEWKYEWLSAQLGKDIVTGAGVAYKMPKNYEVVDIDSATTGNQPGITLDSTPSDTSSVVIYNASGTRITGFTVSGATVDFAAASPAVVVGDIVDVRTYTYATDAATEAIEIDATKFPKSVTAILETIEIDNNENATHTIQYQFTNVLPNGSFSINTSSERSANVQEVSMRALKPSDSTVIGKVLRMPIA
jgi:hypothetical protein